MNKNDLKVLEQKDQVLVTSLSKLCVPFISTTPRNSALKPFYRAPITAKRIESLYQLLLQKKTIAPTLETQPWCDTDGESREVYIARAASTSMWPMGTNYWVRDNALIAARLMTSPADGSKKTEQIRAQGKKVLLSALTIISSQAQLKRFKQVIKSRSKQFRSDPANWPIIFMSIKNNLNAAQPEPWSHKQDAWQILAYYTFKALQDQTISLHELTQKQQQFLGLVFPFLLAVDFINQENSGSWEEIPACRNSVRAWEISLISLIAELADKKEFSFLKSEFNKQKIYLSKKEAKSDLATVAKEVLLLAAHAIASSLPFESANYKKRDWRYREADAAQIYLLMLDVPSLLAEQLGKNKKWRDKCEFRIYQQILRLRDPLTKGYRRYLADSYQRDGFFRYTTCQQLADLYGAPSGDASAHFAGRHKILPKGREAAWCHFNWQLLNWAVQRYRVSKEKKYWKIIEQNLSAGLGHITGAKQYSLDLDATGNINIIKIPQWKIPECYISDQVSKKELLVFPTPHTPLNWAAIEAFAGLNALKNLLNSTKKS